MMQPPTTYDIDSRKVAALAEQIESLLHSEHANFSQGAAALLLALVGVLGTIEKVANTVPQYAELYKEMPFYALQTATMQTLGVLDEYLRHCSTELKQ